MRFRDVIENIESIDDELTIYGELGIDRPFDSEVKLLSSKSSSKNDVYLLEVHVVKIVLRAWTHVRGGMVPNLDEKCLAIKHYIDNDAYLLPENDKLG